VYGIEADADRDKATPHAGVLCTWFSGSKLSHGDIDVESVKKIEDGGDSRGGNVWEPQRLLERALLRAHGWLPEFLA
jgi:hypothetical protein